MRFAIHEDEQPLLLDGGVTDVSRTGLRMNFDRPVRKRVVVGFDIEVNSKRVRVEGTTIWCEQSTDIEFIVGCELHRKLTIPEYIALCDFASESAELGIAS